jgi:hypothetical protein
MPTLRPRLTRWPATKDVEIACKRPEVEVLHVSKVHALRLPATGSAEHPDRGIPEIDKCKRLFAESVMRTDRKPAKPSTNLYVLPYATPQVGTEGCKESPSEGRWYGVSESSDSLSIGQPNLAGPPSRESL